MAIQEYQYDPTNSPAVVGTLTTGKTVTIEVWQVSDGVSSVVNLTSNSCGEIGNTGKYAFDTVNIPVLPGAPTQYHFRMNDGMGSTVEGDFIMKAMARNDGGMPRINLTSGSPYIRVI